MRRKINYIILCLTVFVLMAGCGKSETPTGAESKKEVATNNIVDETSIQMAETLRNTAWTGVTFEDKIFMIAFPEEMCLVKEYDMYGTELLSMETYWSVDPTQLHLYEDAEKTKVIETLSLSLSAENDKTYLTLADTILSYTDINALSDTLVDTMFAAQVVSYLNQGTIWAGVGGDSAYLLTFEGNICTLGCVSTIDGSISESQYAGTWGIDGEYFYLDSDSDLFVFNWAFEGSEEVNCFSFTDAMGESISLYETTSEDMSYIVEVLGNYIGKRANIQQNDDLSTYLIGFRGVSIVEGFLYAGLEPSLANRKQCANYFGITDYAGTSQQNLYLIQCMGGTIK